jgi:hypothetical protein
MMDQQLVARIKRRSKYWGQTAPNQWFDVRVVEDTGYRLRGNNNNYRLDEVVIGVRLASQWHHCRSGQRQDEPRVKTGYPLT